MLEMTDFESLSLESGLKELDTLCRVDYGEPLENIASDPDEEEGSL
jgi:hypothetical protein